MIDSSETITDHFKGLSWNQVLKLLRTLTEYDYTKIEEIKRNYSRHASNFQTTLNFLITLEGAQEIEGNIKVPNVLRSDVKQAKNWVYDRLFSTPNSYRTQILTYLQNFHVFGGEPVYQPAPSRRHHYSHVRNFLMELGIIFYDNNRECYIIESAHFDLFVLAKDISSQQKPIKLKTNRKAKEAIGLAAEKAVISYEKNRVGEDFTKKVEHVAIANSAAGYDVRSVTLEEQGLVKPRYIEVKAVPRATFQFYWTHNEVLVAKFLAEWYFLYLLPITNQGSFDFDQLLMIRNPYANILKAKSGEWIIESNVILC